MYVCLLSNSVFKRSLHFPPICCYTYCLSVHLYHDTVSAALLLLSSPVISTDEDQRIHQKCPGQAWKYDESRPYSRISVFLRTRTPQKTCNPYIIIHNIPGSSDATAVQRVTVHFIPTVLTLGVACLKKNMNASRPFEHPPVRGKTVKTFRRDHRIGCK